MAISLIDINGVIIKGDSVPQALRSSSYNSDSTNLSIKDRGQIIPGNTFSSLLAGADYKKTKLINFNNNMLRASNDILLLNDTLDSTNSPSGSALSPGSLPDGTFNTGAAGSGRQLVTTSNPGSFAAFVSYQNFYFKPQTRILYKSKINVSAHTNGSVINIGFNSVFWQKIATGGWLPVIRFNIDNTDTYGTLVTNAAFIAAIPVTDYAIFSICLEDVRAIFTITTISGTIVSEQIVNFAKTIGSIYSSSFTISEVCNPIDVSNAVGAITLNIANTNLWLLDSGGFNWQQSMMLLNKRSLLLENYAVASAPTSATLSNTTAGYSTFGGQWQFAAVAGAEIDYALFAVPIPGEYSFNCTRISISAYNTGAANATTLTTLQWAVAFNSNAVSLATTGSQKPMRKTIGAHVFSVNAIIGATGGNSIVWNGSETIFPGRYIHIILKVPVATATASQIIRGTCTIEGYFE